MFHVNFKTSSFCIIKHNIFIVTSTVNLFIICIFHGCIIKRTPHIGFLTLDEMERVVEGNHGNDLKEG